MTSPITDFAVPILTYHSVSSKASGSMGTYTVSPAQFDEHLDALLGAGIEVLDSTRYLKVLSRELSTPCRAAVLTFDDGFRDNLQAALSMSARRLSATIFVTSGLLAGGHVCSKARGSMLAPDELRELVRLGWSVGAHGWTHLELDVLNGAALNGEVRRSKADLEAIIGAPVDLFAYPHGYHDRRVRDAVRAAGFTAAFGVGQRLASRADDRFAISRVSVGSTWGPEDLLALYSGPVSDGRVPTRTRAWREVRRLRHRSRAMLAASRR